MGQQFAAVHALRGIAASWVVLFHANAAGHITDFTALLPPWLTIVVFKIGNMGVAMFFAISGFVIAHSLRGAAITPAYVGRFALRRSIRLDPPYWASIIFVVGFAAISALVKEEAFAAPSLLQIISHLLYLQTLLGVDQINDVYWTLTYEIQFYLALVICVALAQRNNLPLIIVVLIPLGFTVAVWIGIATEIRGLFTNLWQCFVVGALAYWAMTDRLAVAALAGVMTITILLSPTLFNMISIGTACGLLLMNKVGYLDQGLNWRPLQFLGTISYSLYLTHNPITGASFFILAGLAIPDWAALLLTLAACVVVAWLFWLVIELPSMKLGRRVKLKKTEPQEPRRREPLHDRG